MMDYHKVNATSVIDVCSPLLIGKCIDARNGTLWFHTLDLVSVYWQMDIHPKDSHNTVSLLVTDYSSMFEHVRMAPRL